MLNLKCLFLVFECWVPLELMLNYLSEVNKSLFIYILLFIYLSVIFFNVYALGHFLRLVRVPNTVKFLLEAPFRWLIT